MLLWTFEGKVVEADETERPGVIYNVPQVVMACYILHNLCEGNGESLNDTWQEDICLKQPHSPSPSSQPTSQAKVLRDFLVQYLHTLSIYASPTCSIQ